jgi:hypothetical protein
VSYSSVEQQLKSIRNAFLYKLIVRILWPIIPIAMEIIIRTLLKIDIVFPDKTILVLAFIIPALFLPDYKGEISLSLLGMCLLFSATPFFCSIVSEDRIIFWIGFFMLLFYIAVFVTLAYLSHRRECSDLLRKIR